MERMYSQFSKCCRAGDIAGLERIDYDLIDIHKSDDLEFRIACGDGKLNVAKFLIELGEDLSDKIDIHARFDYAFRHAVIRCHFHVAEYLLSLEPEYGKIDIHAMYEFAFVENTNIQSMKFLLNLEKTHGTINVHVRYNAAFCSHALGDDAFVIRNFLVRRDPHYNWSGFLVYKNYYKNSQLFVDSVTTLHMCFAKFDSEIMDFNIMSIVLEHLLLIQLS